MKINNIKDLEKLLKDKEDLVNKAIKENEIENEANNNIEVKICKDAFQTLDSLNLWSVETSYFANMRYSKLTDSFKIVS